MKKIVGTKEVLADEKRIAITPKTVVKYCALGLTVWIEAGMGQHLGYADADYEKAGAVLVQDRKKLLREGDIHLRVQKYPLCDLPFIQEGSFHVSFYNPFGSEAEDHTEFFLEKKLTSLSMEMIPRTTVAQKMDALSSQASLAGYAAIMIAAEHAKVLPMMTTPSGTIPPAKVLIIGVGVAGLQAAATARRLGAIVHCYDTRPATKEQVRSLGAKFVEVDLGETRETKDGYAAPLTKEQLDKQREAMAKEARKSDLIITTAALFGKKAPLILTSEILSSIETTPAPIILDMAKETGGNVEGSVLGELVEVSGVKIFAPKNLPGYFAYDASNMYANNLYELVAHFTDETAFTPNFQDLILSSSVVTHSGEIVHEKIAQMQGAS
ncbi:MAG: NAD(P) transhydrogenase subunit alpha [Chlamydiota bacterium]